MTDQRLQALAQHPVARLLWQYSLPSVVGMLIWSIYNVVDRIYIGQGAGPEAISGLAITFPVMNLAAAMGVLVGVGSAARTSIFLGAKQQAKAERVLGNALVLTLIIGTIYTLCFGIWLKPILRAFGATDVTMPYAYDFMIWMLPGLVVTNLCFSFNNIMRASGYPMKALVTNLLGAVLNVILDPIFIFGFDMGIKGAAIASDISMFVAAAFVMWHFCRRSSTVHFRRGIYRIDWRIVWGMVSLGAAPSVVNAASCLITMIVNTSLVHYGTDIDVGACGIFITFTSLLTSVVVGLNMGMQPIVGYNYGAGNLHRLTGAFALATYWATGICTLGCVVGMLWPDVIARAFTSDPGLIRVTDNGFRHALFMFWMVGFQVISTGFFQSIGKAAQSIILGLARQVIFMYPLLKILPHYCQLNGVWLSFPLSDILATLVTIVLILLQFRQLRSLPVAIENVST
ncbi:MAG: MATE family efflux transporter [Bacteroidales bacterium]|nr:MATE family efflux transporter [Bacteroidales bacterium]